LKDFFKRTRYKNSYLLLAAAWLFTFAFAFSTYWSITSSPKSVRNTIQAHLQHQEKDFANWVKDTATINNLINRRESKAVFEEVTGKDYGIYLYTSAPGETPQMRFWNNQHIQPTKEDVSRPAGQHLDSLSNGVYECIHHIITHPDGSTTNIIALLPVYYKYIVENNYLRTSFPANRFAAKRFGFSSKPTEFAVSSSNGTVLFYLVAKPASIQYDGNWLSLVLQLAGILLVLLSVHQWAERVARKKGGARGVLLLILILLLLRSFSYFFSLPLNFRQYELFDPAIYGSNFILRSLGDLLINSILFFWVILFARKHLSEASPLKQVNVSWKAWGIASFIILCMVVTSFVTANVIRGLVADSKFSFDVTSFFSLDWYSVVGFLVLSCIALGYFFLLQLMLKWVAPVVETYTYAKYVLIAGMGLLVLSFRIQLPNLRLELLTLGWILLMVRLQDIHYLRSNDGKYTLAVLLFWIFLFSISISAIIVGENRAREFNQDRMKMARSQAKQLDPNTNFTINIASSSLTSDFLADNFSRLQNDSAAGHAFLDSISSNVFSVYNDNFSPEFYFFDTNDKPLRVNSDSSSFSTLKAIYDNHAEDSMDSGDIRYYQAAADNILYIRRIPITDSFNNPMGTLFFISRPKTADAGESLYPELIKPRRDYIPQYNAKYSWALYDSLRVVKYFHEYPFAISVEPKKIASEDHIREKVDGYDILWYNPGGNKLVAVAKKDHSFIEAITLFAYLFCAFIFLVMLFRFLSIMLQTRFRIRALFEQLQANIRTQVHSTIIFISLLSFIVIGIATINFFINRYQKTNFEKLSRSINIMSVEIQGDARIHDAFEEQLSLYDTGYRGDLQQTVNQISRIHSNDINIYDTLGNLKVSSQPVIYTKGILNDHIHPEAFYNLERLKKVQYIQDEKVGSLEYKSIYKPVFNEQHKVVAYLNIPYYSVQSELEQEISNFLVTIINLNAFIFLIAGALAVFITNRITRTFSLIGDKMRQINLGGINEEINWQRDDEIGELIQEYNIMVRKLEASAAALAKSEREGAWREMARQVAHEIKNPLTPMKLSIQYLQKAIDNNSPDVKRLSGSVAATLIEQIEHLSKIASDFSQFANISNTRNELFDVNEVLNSLISLYSTHEGLTLQWQSSRQKVMLDADKTQINRLFTNLLQNALEATNGELPVIKINEIIRDNTVLLSVSDNGTGIPEEMRTKIFAPNFTTKTSGAGLGLAMCKSIVEQAKGSIWFKTWPGEGTTFYVELPTVEAPVAGTV
jgi:two-component system, NtrC family, nitrogen regulation sensor histidine kinase NtrY